MHAVWFASRLWPGSSALHHLQLLSPAIAFENREGSRSFCEGVGKVRDELGFQLIGYVVMPEHVHLLMSEPESGTPSTVVHRLKLSVARQLRKRPRGGCAGQLRLPFQECGESLQAFWQARFYDFNVYTKKKKAEKLNYMHRNPVTRRLVEHPKDWLWSSWEFYRGRKTGLIPIDVGD